jgi:hypothetical protein
MKYHPCSAEKELVANMGRRQYLSFRETLLHLPQHQFDAVRDMLAEINESHRKYNHPKTAKNKDLPNAQEIQDRFERRCLSPAESKGGH